MTETQREDIPAAQPGQADRPRVGRLLRGLRRILLPLFPPGPRPARRTGRQTFLRTAATLAVLVAGAGVCLVRQAGTPSWQTIWSEDAWLFLPRAVHGPGAALLREYARYLQLVPQLIADGVAQLPLRDAAAGFAIAGALVASSMAIFVYHASRGHIRRPALRALLGCCVLLLPTAVIEIANNGVDSPWYLMFGLFWALLWRPRSAGGKAAVALIAFAAMSSQVANLLFLPLVVARVIALPRLREHAVTAGWLAGFAFQSVQLFKAASGHPLGPAPAAFHFYGQHVVVPAVFGWRLALDIQSAIGVSATIAIAGCVLAAVAALVLWRGDRRIRTFTVTALIMGLILGVLLVMYRHLIGTEVSTSLWVPGGRYATVGILLMDCIAIAGVDAYLRRKSTLQHRARRVVAVVLLLAGLGTGWVTSFRYHNARSFNLPWSKTYTSYEEKVLDLPGSPR